MERGKEDEREEGSEGRRMKEREGQREGGREGRREGGREMKSAGIMLSKLQIVYQCFHLLQVTCSCISNHW